MNRSAAALAHPNIAFIKYWGNRDDALRLPANGSVSMNLAALHTQTSVSFRDDLREDVLTIDGKAVSGAALARVKAFMDQVRRLAPDAGFAEIVSKNIAEQLGIKSEE